MKGRLREQMPLFLPREKTYFVFFVFFHANCNKLPLFM